MTGARKTALRRLSLAAPIVALAATAAFILAGAVGAGGTTTADNGVTAQPTGARSSRATVVDERAVATTRRSARIAGPTNGLPVRYPLGKAGLAAAKKAAETNAPSVAEAFAATPRTPGSALNGFDGQANSGATCPYFGSNGCSPNDMGIASNGEDVVQVVNTSLQIYNTSGVPQGAPVQLDDFFGVPDVDACGFNHTSSPFLSDPRVLWDPADGRFYVAALEVEGIWGIGTCNPPVSTYWVAVSETGDPTGDWNVYDFDTFFFGIGDVLGAADYTQLGFNGNGLFISGNLFTADSCGCEFRGAFVLGMDKKAMEAGEDVTANGFKLFQAKGQFLDTVQPVASYGDGDGGPSGEFLVSSFNVAKPTKGVVVFDFSNVLGDPSEGVCDAGHQCLSGVIVKTATYTQPPQADDGGLCHDCLETIDTRISATPAYMHGNIYLTHDSAAKNRTNVNANVHWVILHPATVQPVLGCGECSLLTTKTSLVDQGFLTYPGETDTWFGAIAPDREGNVFVGFDYNQFDATNPSTAYVARRATAVPGSGFPDGGIFLKLGSDPVGSAAPLFPFRWGDYSAITFEDWNSNNLWFASGYGKNNGSQNTWATHIDRLGYTDQSQQ